MATKDNSRPLRGQVPSYPCLVPRLSPPSREGFNPLIPNLGETRPGVTLRRASSPPKIWGSGGVNPSLEGGVPEGRRRGRMVAKGDWGRIQANIVGGQA
jgi:hypothetical protein